MTILTDRFGNLVTVTPVRIKMKLIRSGLESDELQSSHHALFNDSANRRLLNSIRRAFPKMCSAYVLEWIPEQGENIFTVLVDDNTVATFELSRLNCELAEAQNVRMTKDYQRALQKHKMIKLLIALELAAENAE